MGCARAAHGCLQLVLLFSACGAATAQDLPAIEAPAGSVSSKVLRYAERIVRLHDANGDGQLDPDEWRSMQGRGAAADLNGDGRITIGEFAQHVANYSVGRRIRLATPRESVVATPEGALPPGDTSLPATPADPAMLDGRRNLKYFTPVPAGVPAWFVERDADGDAQLTMAEYSPKLRSSEVAEFRKYDANGDGLLTAAELVSPAATAPPATEAAPPSAPPAP